jgi:prophage tail gpP-like protein
MGQIRRSTASPSTAGGNQVLSATATRDYSSFPTYAMFAGKGGEKTKARNPLSRSYEIDAVAANLSDELQSILGDATIAGRRKVGDTSELGLGQLYRLLYQLDEDSKNAAQLERVAARAVGERLKETLVYSVKLKGFEDRTSGGLFAIDTVIDVQDEVCGIQEPLWVASRKFSFSPTEGATTELECWRLGAFQV